VSLNHVGPLINKNDLDFTGRVSVWLSVGVVSGDRGVFVACYRYFYVVGGGQDLGAEELESARGQYVLAHNGWVMNADPLVNFAAEGTTASAC